MPSWRASSSLTSFPPFFLPSFLLWLQKVLVEPTILLPPSIYPIQKLILSGKTSFSLINTPPATPFSLRITFVSITFLQINPYSLIHQLMGLLSSPSHSSFSGATLSGNPLDTLTLPAIPSRSAAPLSSSSLVCCLTSSKRLATGPQSPSSATGVLWMT